MLLNISNICLMNLFLNDIAVFSSQLFMNFYVFLVFRHYLQNVHIFQACKEKKDLKKSL